MRISFLISALSVLPVQASDLQCKPVKVCVPGSCDVPVNEAFELHLANVDSIAPILHSDGETIPMEKTFERTGTSEWNGINASGEHETLTLHQDKMEFIHEIGSEYVRFVGREVRYRAFGLCEVQ